MEFSLIVLKNSTPLSFQTISLLWLRFLLGIISLPIKACKLF